MRSALKILPTLAALAAASPVMAQSAPAPESGEAAQPSPFATMFTRWEGVAREAREAEEAAARHAQAEAAAEAGPAATATPAMAQRHNEAVALGARVGEVVRNGDCEEGERIARQAGDMPLVAAVRAHCRPRRAPNG